MLQKYAEPIGDLKLTVTLGEIRTRTSIDAHQVLVALKVDAIYNGSRLNRTFNGKYFDSSESSAVGCLAFLFALPTAIIELAHHLTQSFAIDDVPPEWIAQAIDNCLIDLGIALDRLMERESEDAAFFKSFNRMSWLAPLFVGAPCAGWVAIRESKEAALVVGLLVLVATFLTARFLRSLLMPASFWIGEPLGQRVLRAYGVSTVWGVRLISLLCIAGLATALCATLYFILG